MANPERCTQMVPDALTRGLRPSPRCTLGGPGQRHKGDHRAHHTEPGVGKVLFKWKGERRVRPQVTLPVPSADHINPANGRLI